MDRFEDFISVPGWTSSFIYIPVWIDLKVFSLAYPDKVLRIYIPVWIDLKVFIAALPLTLFAYLHSSMDRFEASKAGYIKNVVDIYIPVWIDLK